ncbi:cytochrome P450 [Pholiota conissans]|uniref:Cytochrome P450 n=1 Tax=Pholiota conissans TaxID=109636 RepID=A0A9P6D3Q5_9AGAR|nr:cytochrome P450 [Pholiota conissans]
MSDTWLTSAFVCGIILLVSAVGYSIHRPSKRWRLPPGPRGIPLLGNIFNIPDKNEWKAYQRWSSEYKSDIIHLNMAGTPMIILNSREVSHDLLEKRSAIYSDRPRYVMLNELSGFTWDFNFQGYTKEWKDRRKLFTRELQPPKSLLYRDRTSKAINNFLHKLINGSADSLVEYLRHMAGEIILSTAYGLQIKPENDSYIKLSEVGLTPIIKSANWGSYFVDFFPVLKLFPSWLPGMSFKGEAKLWKILSLNMVQKPFDAVEKQIAAGIPNISIASASLEAIESEDTAAKIVIRDTLGAMYEAGADTTVSALSTFFLAMLLYPEVQKRGRQAMIQAISNERLPIFSDMQSIPYVDAIIKEVLRWRPVAPLALPHRLVADDEYNGYFLPSGSVVVGNSWAILHDKSTYGEDVDTFRPERFLRDDQPDPEIPYPDAAFGFGRRMCPGQDMAWSSMWLTIASVLFLFDVQKATGDDGVPIEPSGKYTSGMQIYPKPFRCTIKLRSPELASLVLLNE